MAVSRFDKAAPLPLLLARLRRSCAAGFTMIEVLVALAIVAIALAAALRAMGALAVGSAQLRARLLASWSADNALAQAKLAQAWPELGSTHFDCPQGNQPLICTRIVSATPNPLFRRVEVLVRSPAQSGILAQLVTVVPDESQRSL